MEKFPGQINNDKVPKLREVEGSDIGYGPALKKDVPSVSDDSRKMVEVGRNEAGYGEYEFRELTLEEERIRQRDIRQVLTEIGVIGSSPESPKKKKN